MLGIEVTAESAPPPPPPPPPGSYLRSPPPEFYYQPAPIPRLTYLAIFHVSGFRI